MRLRAVVTHGLTDLADLQSADHPGTEPERQRQRCQDAENPAQGQVLEYAKPFMELLQVLSEQQQHD
ncbi:hypothetical protein D9M71_227450 [compost metagenome]